MRLLQFMIFQICNIICNIQEYISRSFGEIKKTGQYQFQRVVFTLEPKSQNYSLVIILQFKVYLFQLKLLYL